MLCEKGILHIDLPNNSNIEKLRSVLNKIISEKYLKNNLHNLSKTAAFFSETNEVINDNNCSWFNDLSLRNNIHILSSDLNYEWLIIGAGYKGLSCERFRAKSEI